MKLVLWVFLGAFILVGALVLANGATTVQAVIVALTVAFFAAIVTFLVLITR